MNRPLNVLELDFLGDLRADDIQIWQVFEFVKLHHKSISDKEAFQLAQEFLIEWIQQNWIDVVETKGKREKFTPETLAKYFQKHGLSLLTQFDSTVHVEITEKGEEVYDAAHSPQNS